MTPEKSSVLVIGAGIIGAMIGWRLARAGHRVRIVASRRSEDATAASFAWINASYDNPEPYFRLRRRAMEGWRDLRSELPDLPVAFRGGLCWDLEPEALRSFLKQHASWGYDIRAVDGDAASLLEPGLAQPPDLAVHVASEGVAEPVATTLRLLDEARASGAELHLDTKVTALFEDHGQVTGALCGERVFSADRVVLAAGVGSRSLAASIGVGLPIDEPPGLLVYTEPAPPMLNGVVLAPGIHMRQTLAGRIVAGADFAGGMPGDDPREAADHLFSRLRHALRDGDSLSLSHFTFGRRPMPADGFPIIGPVEGRDGLYVAVTHSGITLAPAIGAMVAGEIAAGVTEPMLEPYRLARFSRGESKRPAEAGLQCLSAQMP